MNHKRWGLLAAAVTVIAGIGLLGVSGGFIVATGIAGLAGLGAAFNLLVPSALIRLLALTRVAAGYASRLWLHDAMLDQINGARVALFRRWAQSPRLARGRHGWQLDALINGVDRIGLALLTKHEPRATGYATGALLALTAVLTGLHWPLLALGLGSAGAALVAAGASDAHHAHDRARAAQVSQLTHSLLSCREWLAYQKPQPWVVDTSATLNALKRKTARLAQAGLVLDLALLITAALVLVPLSDPIAQAAAVFVLMAAREPLDQWVASFGHAGTGDEPESVTLSPAIGALRADQLRVGFDGPLHKVALNFDVEPGQRLWIQGASGSGKTALLDTLAGLLAPVDGRVRRPKRLSYTPQFPFMFDDSVAANLSLYAAIDPDRARQLLDQLGLGARFELDSLIGPTEISGGEARRLGLIRAALQPSDAWLLDEPLVGLDQDAAQAVLALLQDYQGALVVVSHDSRVERLSGLERVELDAATDQSGDRRA